MKALVMQAMVADGLIQHPREHEKRARQSGTADWKRRRGEDGAQVATTTEESALETQDHRMEQDGH